MSRTISLPRALHAAGLALALFTAACAGDDPTPSGCTPGTADGCPSGQLCSAAGVCEATGAVSGALVIDSADARACEVLLASETTEVLRATFGDGVTGAMRSRAPRTAIAVASVGGGPFAADAIRLELVGAAADVQVASVDCYDATGAAITGASASIQ